MFDFLRKFLGGKKTHVEIGFEQYKAKAQLSGEKHLSDKKVEAAKLIRNAIKDQVEALGGNVELHPKVIEALVAALLNDPGVKAKLMNEATQVALKSLVEQLTALTIATTVAANTMAEDNAEIPTPPAA